MCFVLWQWLTFPTQHYYRSLVRNAEFVELDFSVLPDFKKCILMTKVTARDDLNLLANSIKFRGIWLPLETLVGNSYRIRVRKKNGMIEDIIVRGWNGIRYGRWTISISPSLIKTIKDITRKNGGQLPDEKTIKELLD